jgi:hypothetical protein
LVRRIQFILQKELKIHTVEGCCQKAAANQQNGPKMYQLLQKVRIGSNETGENLMCPKESTIRLVNSRSAKVRRPSNVSC